MKSILVIGMNNFGALLAAQLASRGHQVMAVDRREERVNAVLPAVTDARIGDSTDPQFLRSLGINNYDVCFVAISRDFQNSLETTSLLKELGGRQVISLASREIQAKFLLRNGADDVIRPLKQVAEWAAIRYASECILDYIRLDDDHAVLEVSVPPDWAGRTVEELNVRKKFGLNIMAVRDHGHMNLSVRPETRLRADETLLVLGSNKSIRKCFHL